MFHLGLFAKHWTPGDVKTRLAISIGQRAAASVHKQLLVYLLQSLSNRVFLEGEFQRDLVFAPPSSSNEFQEIAGDWKLVHQSPGNLGIRLGHYVQETFLQGASGILLIGSDCPRVSPLMVQDVRLRLRQSDLVIGPARDGGYYLMAMNQPYLSLFDAVEWSTPQVLRQTMLKANHLKLRIEFLSTLEDVDDLDSLSRVTAELCQSSIGEERDLGHSLQELMRTQ